MIGYMLWMFVVCAWFVAAIGGLMVSLTSFADGDSRRGLKSLAVTLAVVSVLGGAMIDAAGGFEDPCAPTEEAS